MADFIKRISDSASLTDILIQMESWLDNLDIYVFKNWFEGEVIDGPTIERHWVSMILKYPYNKMPDPAGGMRLLKYGAKVIFKKEKEEDTTDHNKEDIAQINDQLEADQDTSDENFHLKSDKPQLVEVWLVEIKIPRHFIDELESMTDLTDDGIDPEHLKAAHDSDLQAKDAYQTSNGEEDDQTQDESIGEDDQKASDGNVPQ